MKLMHMKKLLLLFILGITYAVDCPICNENLIEIPGNSNDQSKNAYVCSNKHSFQLTTDNFTQFDQANSIEKSKINYYTPQSLEESRSNKVDQTRKIKHLTLLLSLGLAVSLLASVSLLI